MPNYEEYLEKSEITYSDIMRLSEVGLIFNDALITLNFELSQNPEILFINEELIMTLAAKNEGIHKGVLNSIHLQKLDKNLQL